MKRKQQKSRKKWMFLILGAVILIGAGFFLYSYLFPKPDDFSRFSWVDAFNKMHSKLSKEYAFTKWKKIDWQTMYDRTLPEITSAQDTKNFDAYYLALRSYLTTIPDGHVRTDNLKEIDDKYIGGGFGFSAVKLTDGSIIASWIDKSGPAYEAGMEVGARLIRWNKEPIDTAIANVSTVFAGTSPTIENLEYKKVQYLTRAPIGAEVEIEFQNPNQFSKVITLKAYDDHGLSLKKNYPDAVISNKIRSMFLNLEDPDPIPSAMVESKTLEGNISYIKILGEIDADLKESGKMPSTLDLFRQAVQTAIDAKSAAIILDLRNNIGGLDAMAADILGNFYQEKTLFEYQNMYNETTGKLEIVKIDSNSDALYIEPAQAYFGGNIIVLINQKCVSSCEGIAMGVQNLPNGKTLGFYGTNGSFGMAGAEIKMPGGLTVHFPSGQSLNKDREVQLDSKDGLGGVSPSIRIPMTAENAIRVVNGEDVELEEALRIIKQNRSF